MFKPVLLASAFSISGLTKLGLLLHISGDNMEICGLTSRTPYLFELNDGKFTKRELRVGERIEYLLKINN